MPLQVCSTSPVAVFQIFTYCLRFAPDMVFYYWYWYWCRASSIVSDFLFVVGAFLGCFPAVRASGARIFASKHDRRHGWSSPTDLRSLERCVDTQRRSLSQGNTGARSTPRDPMVVALRSLPPAPSNVQLLMAGCS